MISKRLNERPSHKSLFRVPKDEVISSSTFKSICCIVLVWGEEYNSRVSPEVVSGIYRGKG